MLDNYRHHPYYERFLDFHNENPQVAQMIVSELHRAIIANIKKVSIKTIIGKIRWDMTISTHSHDGFKINDAYTSLYARLILEDYPHFKSLFECREVKC